MSAGTAAGQVSLRPVMDVVVCGAQVPYVTGGAELLMENLVAALGAAGHRAELVRLPVAWERERLFDAPTAWRLIPIDADLAICINFPSYYVRARRKVVWLAHQHRGAYDAADADWSDFGADDASLETQRLLTEWDNRALSEAESVFTISQAVADRLARYNGLAGVALYHPPPLADELKAASTSAPPADLVFCPARMEANKRPELLVAGMAHAPLHLRAVAAGRGSRLAEMQALAVSVGVADRVSFPGFVTDHDLVDLFARALAVVYAPLDEDYGYVTLQAFLTGTPVVTAADSGGVLEWVEDGVSGLVTDGTPEGVGEALARLDADRAWAARLGEEGRRRVTDLDWTHVVATLTGRP